MPENQAQLIAQIKELVAFRHLPDADLGKVVAAAKEVSLEKDEVVSAPPNEQAPFYMVISGGVKVFAPGEKKQPDPKPRLLRSSDFFGADHLLFGKVSAYQAVAETPTRLLCLESRDLRNLLLQMPALQDGLKSALALHKMLRSKHFRWLNPDEGVHLVCRKHPAYLLVALALPALIALVALALFGLSGMAGVASVRLAFLWIGLGVAILAAGLGVWRWVDWQNDYYLVTNQRVVWLEQVFGLYDSRVETPLRAIKSSEVRSSQSGRILGYGTLTIRAFMGQVVFADIANPEQVKALVDKQQRAAQEQVQRADKETMEHAVRHKIEPPAEVAVQAESSEAEPKPGAQAKSAPKPFLVRLVNDFKTRLEEGDTITYRKHIFVLMIKIWAPTLLELALMGATFFLARARLQESITFPSMATLLLLSSFLSFGLLLWWLYQYIDWRNDIYQITLEKIVDSERKPLGTEVTKSAPLANILSLDYERIGFLGVLLNFGNVNINVGAETRFDFMGIHDPARAQQDIFNRMYDYQRRQQQGDLLKQGEQIVDWIAAYHRQADDLRNLKKGDGK